MGVAIINMGVVINECGLSLKYFVKSLSLCFCSQLHSTSDFTASYYYTKTLTITMEPFK